MPDRRRWSLTLLPVVALLLGGCAATGPAPGTASAPGGQSVHPTVAPTDRTPTANDRASSTPVATDRGLVATAPARPAAPDRVRIDRIGVDERVIGLGLTRDGTLAVPSDPDRVGWFTGGGRPGGPGPTVLVGHVDSRTGPAVFARLTELRVGDVVEVIASDGTMVRYRVSRTEDFAKNAFPTEAVFGSSPVDELRLITCTGVWDRVERSHRDNRVVFARPV